MNIIEWMIERKLAQNTIQAANIANGLKLAELATDEERCARILLYRKWRPKTDKKNQLPTWQAFELAIAGIDRDDVTDRQIEMPIEGALLSTPLWNVTYYTLSDCKASKDIRAKTGSDAEKIAREKDDTFDRLIGVSIILEAA